MKRIYFRCTAIATVLFATVFSPGAQAQVKLQLINEYPATSITADADLRFAKEVEKASGQAITIETKQDKDNPFKGDEQVKAVSQGKTQMGTLFGGVLGNDNSLFLLSSLPFAAKDFAQAKALYECAKPALAQGAEKLDAHLLYVTPWPPSGIWSVQPLTNETDIKALKIRTYDATSKSVFERLGAQSVQLPYSALAEKLQKNEVNAVLTSGDGGAGRKLWTQLPNFMAVSYSIPLSYTIINMDTWRKLDDAQRTILTNAAEKVAAESWAGVEQRIEANYARMRENKMTLNTAPPESIMTALKKAGEEETTQWLKDNHIPKNEAGCVIKDGA